MDSFTNRVLWWALVASLLIYAVVAHVVPLPMDPEMPTVPLMVALGVVSVGTAVGTLLYRRHALVRPIQQGALDPARPEGQARAFQAFVLNIVLSESVGIYGLVLAFLSGKAAYSLPFIVAAVALLYAHRPTAPDLQPPPGGGHAGGRPAPIA